MSPKTTMQPPTTALDQLARAFAAAGHHLYRVGGCVRDDMLGRVTHDQDLTTDASPDQTKRILRSLPNVVQSIYTIGEKFGTIGAIIEGAKTEITTFRSDSYDGRSRKPLVQHTGVRLEDDLARRDFTINAMAQPLPSGEIIDPFGGQRDLAARVVCAVGTPALRFAEDPLRLLRAVRFATVLDFTIEPATYQAMQEQADTLSSISRERVAEEMNRILLAPRPSTGLRLLCDSGLMMHIIPEILPMIGMKQGVEYRFKDVYTHVLQVVDRSPATLTLRWAALLHDIAKPATFSYRDGKVHFYGHETRGADMARTILTRLKMENGLIADVTEIVAMHMRINTYDGEWTDGAVRRFMREAGTRLDDLFALSRADITSHRFERVQAVLRQVDTLESHVVRIRAQEEVAQIHSPLDGHDLMEAFSRPPGPWIAPIKDYLLDLVLDGHLAQDDRTTAMQLAHAFVTQTQCLPQSQT